MIPKIKHSRAQLKSNLHYFENGDIALYVSSDTYPDLFDFSFPSIRNKTSAKWTLVKYQKHLRFPQDSLTEDDINSIALWQIKFKQYVLIEINNNIETHFNKEMDFCIALDYNFNEKMERTHYGKIEYRMKYKDDFTSFNEISEALSDLFSYLPIYPKDKNTRKVVISSIPEKELKECFVNKLARRVAETHRLKYLPAYLNCDKKKLKNLPINEKISEWNRIYSDPNNVSLPEDIKGKTIVIIDDLYQSGISMWSYAKYLKSKGAKYVLGMVCVKSLRDTDNKKHSL